MEFIKSIYKVSDEVVFGKEFKILKELPKGRIYMKIGGSLSEHEEYFYAYEENGMLEYKIIDDNSGMPSIANTSDSHFAKNLRRFRNDNALTQVELAELAGISSKYVYKLEGGEANPSIVVLNMLSKALAVPITSFFLDEDRRKVDFD